MVTHKINKLVQCTFTCKFKKSWKIGKKNLKIIKMNGFVDFVDQMLLKWNFVHFWAFQCSERKVQLFCSFINKLFTQWIFVLKLWKVIYSGLNLPKISLNSALGALKRRVRPRIECDIFSKIARVIAAKEGFFVNFCR